MIVQNDNKSKGNDDEISVKDLIFKLKQLCKYLLSQWLIILFLGVVGCAIGFAYGYFKKPVYKAELTFALEDDKSGGGGLGSALGLASQFGIDIDGGSGSAFSGDNLILLLKSRKMIESTLLTPIQINGKQQTLAELYINFLGLREKWKAKNNLKNITFPSSVQRSKFSIQQDSILGIMSQDISNNYLIVDRADKKASIFVVKVSSENEMFSKLFTEILVEKVSDFYIETKTKRSSQNVRILQKQTDSVRHELNAAITGVAASIDVNPNLNPSLQILRVPAQRRQVDVQTNQAILTQLVANLEISKVSLRKETPLIQIIDSPILPLSKEKIGKSVAMVIGGMIAVFISIIGLIILKILR